MEISSSDANAKDLVGRNENGQVLYTATCGIPSTDWVPSVPTATTAARSMWARDFRSQHTNHVLLQSLRARFTRGYSDSAFSPGPSRSCSKRTTRLRILPQILLPGHHGWHRLLQRRILSPPSPRQMARSRRSLQWNPPVMRRVTMVLPGPRVAQHYRRARRRSTSRA